MATIKLKYEPRFLIKNLPSISRLEVQFSHFVHFSVKNSPKIEELYFLSRIITPDMQVEHTSYWP